MGYEPLDHRDTYYPPLANPTLLEIADRLEELGYEHRATVIRAGTPEQLLASADWLRDEAGYVKRTEDTIAFLEYAQHLRQAAELELAFS